MDERFSPESLLKGFLANQEYGLWRYDRRLYTRPKYFDFTQLPGEESGESFDKKREEIERHIEDLRYLELVNPYLFPKYDEYEKVLSDYISSLSTSRFCEELKWPECIQMPRSTAFPNGGCFSRLTFKVPADLFNGISGRFFDKCDIRIECIYDTRFFETFWINLNPGYLRKESLAEWSDGKFKRILANGTLLVMDKTDCKRQVIPAVMSILFQAWTDHCEALRSDKAVWASLKAGRRRYVNNTRELMLQSGDKCLMKLGEFFEQIALLSIQPDLWQKFECKDGPLIGYKDIHKDVQLSAEHLVQSPLYKLCLCAWTTLGDIEKLLEEADSRKIVEIWNRCARQKVTSKEDILSLVISKYLGICPDILSRLAANIVYERFKTMTGYWLH